MTNVVWDKYDNTATIVTALAQSTSAEQAIQLYENAVEELGKLFATVYANNLKDQAIQLYENAVEELGKLFAAVYADNLKED